MELILRGQSLNIIFKLSDALLLSKFIVFKSRNDSLKLSLVSLLVLGYIFEAIELIKDLVSFKCDLVASF